MLEPQQILALVFLPGISSAAVRALVESGPTFDEIVAAPPARLAAHGLRRGAIEALAHPEPYLERAAEQLALAADATARIVFFWDDAYPPRLREIYSPPTVLYCRGELLERDRQAVAIVGTRNATTYGRVAAERYATELAAAGVTVISGLARGIDTYAHAATLAAGGRTIAVVASGLDRIGPAPSATLAVRIAGSGAVVSEYPFGTRAVPAYFPQRNRIISGMAKGTVVVESDVRGGAMITAGFALDQNRDVFAVPGSIGSTRSRGTNELIRTDRARLTQSPDDLLEALGYRVAVPGVAAAARERPELTMFEQQIFDSLDGDPVHIDTLAELTGLGPSELLVNLLSLEFKGAVRQMAGRMFVRVV